MHPYWNPSCNLENSHLVNILIQWEITCSGFLPWRSMKSVFVELHQNLRQFLQKLKFIKSPNLSYMWPAEQAFVMVCWPLRPSEGSSAVEIFQGLQCHSVVFFGIKRLSQREDAGSAGSVDAENLNLLIYVTACPKYSMHTCRIFSASWRQRLICVPHESRWLCRINATMPSAARLTRELLRFTESAVWWCLPTHIQNESGS